MSIASEISRLQTAKADLKTSIEGKGVTVPSSAKLDDYPDLVDQISGGSGTNLLEYATCMFNLFCYSENMPQRVEITLKNLNQTLNNGRPVQDMFFHAYESSEKIIGTIDVIIKLEQTNISLYRMFFNAYGVKTVTFIGDLSGITNYNYIFDYCSGLTGVYGTIDFSSCTTNQNLCDSLSSPIVDMTFAPNSLSYNLNIMRCSSMFSNASIISAANCLNPSATGKSIKYQNISKAKLSTIMGVNDNGLFVEDAQGTLNLADFITNVKGWTIA